ncbi:MAG: hypothetical protein Q9207_007764 [Kuettlingeria erythrocarpa]
MLQVTLMSRSPVDRTDGKERFRAGYVVKQSGSPPILDTLEKDLVAHGFDPNTLGAFEVFSINPHDNLPDDDSAYDNYFDTVHGIIVANMNFNALDTRRDLNWSEIMYQTWQRVNDEYTKARGPISNLRAVVQKTVTNLGTRTVLKTMYDTLRLPINQGDPNWYSWTETKAPQFFMALLGTDNVKGTIWLLNDHAAEIGKKEITTIWTRWTNKFPEIWIEIGYPEQTSQIRARKVYDQHRQ